MKQSVSKLFVLLCLFKMSNMFGQTVPDISIGKYDSIASKVLQEEQWVMVYVPESLDSSEKFPVLYVLDGAWRFYSTVGMVKELGGSLIPKMIVVGILNNNRFRDFSPPGIPAFTTYMEDELLPHIEQHYPAAPYRCLIGHSLAGLFATDILVKEANLFDAYVLIDPSLSHGNTPDLLNEYLTSLQQNTSLKKEVQLAIANTLPENMDTSTVRKDTSSSSLHIRSILQLADALQQNKTLKTHCIYYKHEDHTSVPIPATYNALRSLFDYYEMPEDIWEIGNPANQMLRKHYELLSKRLGYTLLPPEATTNVLGYFYMNRGALEEAEAIFKLNQENYPNSFNVYDSLGDLYAAKGEVEKAIAQYKKALDIQELAETRGKLKKLMGN